MPDSTATPEAPCLEIHAIVADSERPILTTAARLLSDSLEAALQGPCQVKLTFGEAVRSDFLIPGGPEIPQEVRDRGLIPAGVADYQGTLYDPGQRIVVLSLLTDLLRPALRHRQDGWAFFPAARWEQGWDAAQRTWVAEHLLSEPVLGVHATAQHLATICAEVLRLGATAVFLFNVFRHEAGPPPHRYYGSSESLRERIQRFNLLAAELSWATGAFVLDLDRLLARSGARRLATDYSLQGEAASAAAAVELVSTLFKAGLDDYFTAEVQTRAMNHFEANRARRGWLRSQYYHHAVLLLLREYQKMAHKDAPLTEEAAHRCGRFLLDRGVALQLTAPPDSLALHNQLLSALGEAGNGYLEYAQAMSAQDAAARASAAERIRHGMAQLRAFCEEFNAFYLRGVR